MPVRIVKRSNTLPPGAISRAEVQQMLAERDAQWQQQLSALTAAFARTLATTVAPSLQRPNSSVKLKYDQRGVIVGADITHEKRQARK